PFQEIAEVEMAGSFAGAEIAGGEESAEPSIGSAVARPCGDVRRAVAEDEPAADRIACFRLLRREMAADSPGERVPIGDGEAAQAEYGRGRGDLLRMRCASQE